MNYVWDFAILGKYSHLFWLGLGWTIAYTIGTIILGTLIGLVVGILRLRRWPVIDWLLVAYIELFRCTPLLVQIIWFYYAFPVVIGVNIPAHVAAASVLSLYGGAFYAEIVRGSIESVHRGQWDAARALGLRSWRTLRLVILPQALKPMLAPYVNQSVTLEEYLARIGDRGAGPRLQRDPDQRRNLSAAGGVYDRGLDLFCDPVSGHARCTAVRARHDL
jgi:polar amino acid transport system permease protein